MDWFGAVTLLIGRGGRRLSFWRAAPFAALLTLVGVTLLCAILFDVSAAHAVEAVNVRTAVTAALDAVEAGQQGRSGAYGFHDAPVCECECDC